MLCLCLRRVSDSCILGGRAVRGIISPSLPWQGQWDNICKVAPKSSFSPKRWIQATAGRGWLRAWHLQADEKYFIKESHGKWFGTAHPDHPNPAQPMPALIFRVLQAPSPPLGEGRDLGHLQENVKFSEKNACASLIPVGFLF